MQRPARSRLARVVLLAALAWPSAAAAERALVLAFDELPPWKTLAAPGQYGGAYTEIVRELARRAGLPLDIVHCPLKRCMRMLEQGTADLAIGYKDSPERRRFLHFLVTPYRTLSADKVFYTVRGKGVAIASYRDLAGLRIGVKSGASYFARFDNDAALNKDAARDMEVNLRKLLLGRLDTVLIPEDQGEALLARLDLGALLGKAAYREHDPTPRSVALSKASPHVARLAQLERAMADMARDGTLEKIYRRHYFDAMHVAPGAVSIR
ncbi:MAG: transporter substrate-binding domain-containing protein [Pseudomonadota bacterium]